MDFGTVALFVVIAVVIAGIVGSLAEQNKVAAMTPADQQTYRAKKAAASLTFLHGHLKPMMVCPHCQTKGQVRTQPVTRKKGISGGKAVGAILTGGVSLLATGLSRKESTTEAYCGNCTAKWDF
jgi:hypothetical protein